MDLSLACARLQWSNVVCIEYCQIGDCFWIVGMMSDSTFEVARWNQISGLWILIYHKNTNGNLVDNNSGLAETNFSIEADDRKIKLTRRYMDKTSQCFEFDTITQVWRRIGKYGVNRQFHYLQHCHITKVADHAWFTANHILDGKYIDASCQVGDDLWVVRRCVQKLNSSESRKWVRTDFQIEDLFGNERCCSHSVCTYNNQLFLLMMLEERSELLELDLKSVEWKKLIDVDMGFYQSFSFPTNFFMMDKTLCRVRRKEMMRTNLETGGVTTTELPTREDKHNYFCESDGKLFLIELHSSIQRIVHEYDKERNRFNKVKEDHVDYLIDDPSHTGHVWATASRIYLAMSSHTGDPLRIDYFDVLTSEWHHLLTINDVPFPIQSVTGNDRTIYVQPEIKGCTEFREIDLTPKLETIAMGQLADTLVHDKIDAQKVKVPIGLKGPLVDMVNWKTKDIERLLTNYGAP